MCRCKISNNFSTNIFGKIDKKKRNYTYLNLTIPPTIIVRIDQIKEENEDVLAELSLLRQFQVLSHGLQGL